ncbi:hypothetical protein [Pseudovibrio sp. SCP19]|uniref:hypothetical protein n=1 Tax=Pseudovibrio sp. SCP19 TaxID=3141374 RepID=UPI00333AA9DD
MYETQPLSGAFLLTSNFMIEMPSGKRVQIKIDRDTLLQIAEEVRGSETAIEALREGKRRHQEAHARGDISSPEPPAEYAVIYKIMNNYDVRYAGALGSEIIEYLQETLLP